MGQYYKIALKRNGENLIVNDRKVEGCDYMMAKLMEHSYLGNKVCDAVSEMIHNHPSKVAWVGDYADEDNEVSKATGGELSYEKVWGESADDSHRFSPCKFDYTGKFLVNHTKKACISFDRWIAAYGDNWPIYPVSLLTTIGNGRGGGDYGGNAMARIGSWIWDEIEIVDSQPEGYEVLDFAFNEGEEFDEDNPAEAGKETA